VAALVIGAVPVMWWVTVQARADRGEVSPEAAAVVYVLSLSSGDHLGLSRVLDAGRHDELVDQWRTIRADMDRATPPSKLETVGRIDVEDQDDGRAVVVARVRGIWWDAAGPGTSMVGTAHEWRWDVVDEHGWRIRVVHAPPWCGVHVRADRCQEDPTQLQP